VGGSAFLERHCRLGDKSETHERGVNGGGRRKTASGNADEQHR
jgi:hypothetical protein